VTSKNNSSTNSPPSKTIGPKVVVIGGGTGAFGVLSGLKNYVRDLTAIVNMIDDGGSSGILRDEMGALPPGDMRQSLVALSSASNELRQLLNFRFPEGSLAGHSFGNLLISALEKVTGSIAGAVRVASEILAIQGTVLPVTTDDARLMLETADGRIVRGEDKIGEGPASERLFVKGEPHRLWLEPEARLNPHAQTAIESSDLIVIAPGKLYSSILPTFLVKGLPEALRNAKGKKILICNLMTRPNQTAGFTVQDFAAEIERYAGEPVLGYVIYNTESPAAKLLEKYALEGEREPVEFDSAALAKQHYIAIGEPLISRAEPKRAANDKLMAGKRTLIRHDSDRLARLIMRSYFS
jgi:uncharacterized cofD-like protein